MAQPLRQINKLLSSITASGKLGEEEVIALLVAVRRLIESEKKQADFPAVWFYCNWSLHSQIERGLTKEWLKRISKALAQTPSNPWYTDQIASTMAMDQVRAEFIRLFRAKHLPLFLFESASNWQVVFRQICVHIVGTPLIATDAAPPDSDPRFWVTSLRLEIIGEDPVFQECGKLGEIVVVIQTDDEHIRIVAPMVIPELKDAFRFP